MLEVGEDPRLVVLLGDLSHFLLRDFEAAHKDRFYNLGIAEQSMMSIAAGLAMNGLFPVVHSIAPFITERCFEQIKDDLCYQKLGVNIVSIGSAFDYAALGCTHHCYDDIAILRALPGMQIVYPAAPHEFDTLFKETYANGMPTYFRLPEHVHEIPTHPRFGEVEMLHKGGDVTVAVSGPQLQNAFEAVKEIENTYSCDLIYCTTIKPLSEKARQTLRESVKKTGRLVTVEEHSVIGGIGDEIARVCDNIRFVHERMGIHDRFLTNYGTYAEHCRDNDLTKEGVIHSVHEICTRNI